MFKYFITKRYHKVSLVLTAQIACDDIHDYDFNAVYLTELKSCIKKIPIIISDLNHTFTSFSNELLRSSSRESLKHHNLSAVQIMSLQIIINSFQNRF